MRMMMKFKTILFFIMAFAGLSRAVINEGVQYIGYSHSNAEHNPDGVIVRSEANLNRIIELGNSNIATLIYRSAYIAYDLDKAYSNGMLSWVGLYDIFFHWVGGGHMGDGDAMLRTDWQTRWQAFKNEVSGHEHAILGFDFGEAYWVGVATDDFLFVCDKVRDDFPNKRVRATLCVISLDPAFGGYSPSLEIPDNYLDLCTDAAFDYYTGQWYNPSLTTYYYRFLELTKDKARLNQDIWVYPTSFLRPGSSIQTAQYAEESVVQWYKVAINDPRVVGLICYNYASNMKVSPPYIALDQIFDYTNSYYDPYLKSIHINIGRNICNNSGNVYSASTDYNDTQSYENWQYADSVNGLMAWTGSKWQSTTNSSCWIEPGLAHPATSYQTILKWTAPKAGYVRISSTGNFRKAYWDLSGDGVDIAIKKNSSVIWPSGGGWQRISAANTTGVYASVRTYVYKNDIVSFIVDPIASGTGDSVYLDPVITYDLASEPDPNLIPDTNETVWIQNDEVGIWKIESNWNKNAVPGTVDSNDDNHSAVFLGKMLYPCRITGGIDSSTLQSVNIGDWQYGVVDNPATWLDPCDPNTFSNTARVDMAGGHLNASDRILVGCYRSIGETSVLANGIFSLMNGMVTGITEVGRNGNGILNIYGGIYDSEHLGLGYNLDEVGINVFASPGTGVVNLVGGTLIVEDIYINDDSMIWVDDGTFILVGSGRAAELQNLIDAQKIKTHSPNGRLVISNGSALITDAYTAITCDWGGDINRDQKVNMLDLELLVEQWLNSSN